MIFAAPLATAAVALSGTATISLPSNVTVEPSGAAAKVQGGGVRLPVLGNGPGGVIRLGGGARLAHDGHGVKLSGFEFDGKTVTAKVNGINRRDAFTLSARKVTARPLKTTVRAQARATDFLGLGPVSGTFSLTAKRKAVKLVGGQTTLSLDPAFVDMLNAAGIEPSAGEGATVTDQGAYQFPIGAGRLVAPKLEGTIGTGGGVAFNKSARAGLQLEDYVFDTRSNVVRGRVDDGPREEIFDVDFPRGSLQDDFIVFGAATVTLTQRTADALNSAFEATGFAAGQTVGTFTVTAQPA